MIVGVIAVFAAFNAVVSHHELVQSLPRARSTSSGSSSPSGVAFVPITITAIHDVREADRARTGGRAVRRGRLVRQIVPVLENGLERVGDPRGVDGLARLRARRADAAGAGRRLVRRARAARARRARSSR